ncbi:MAG: CSLREA domain-containing protein, partial [Deltaproteobacteria bacterium]|nr:CSLREA domain-containing protein [Deltaproteobacteria bacterium]
MKAIKPSKQVLASTVTGAALLLGSVAPAHALGITVNSTADNTIDDTHCTLREALVAANINEPYNGCDTGAAGTDTIDLTSVSGTIILVSNLTPITGTREHIVLNGPGAANLTIDGGGTFRTINSPGIDNDVTVEDLTITQSSGHGIYAQNSITVTNSTISGNTGDGV